MVLNCHHIYDDFLLILLFLFSDQLLLVQRTLPGQVAMMLNYSASKKMEKWRRNCRVKNVSTEPRGINHQSIMLNPREFTSNHHYSSVTSDQYCWMIIIIFWGPTISKVSDLKHAFPFSQSPTYPFSLSFLFYTEQKLLKWSVFVPNFSRQRPVEKRMQMIFAWYSTTLTQHTCEEHFSTEVIFC